MHLTIHLLLLYLLFLYPMWRCASSYGYSYECIWHTVTSIRNVTNSKEIYCQNSVCVCVCVFEVRSNTNSLDRNFTSNFNKYPIFSHSHSSQDLVNVYLILLCWSQINLWGIINVYTTRITG